MDAVDRIVAGADRHVEAVEHRMLAHEETHAVEGWRSGPAPAPGQRQVAAELDACIRPWLPAREGGERQSDQDHNARRPHVIGGCLPFRN